MDLKALPVVTQQDVDQAFNDKLKATGTALVVTTLVSGFNFALNAPGGFAVQFGLKALSGVKAEPGPAGRGIISVPKAAAAQMLLPQPLGFVPAEAYGLHPEIYKQVLGMQVGQKPPFFSVSESRLRVFEAQLAAQEIFRRVTMTPNGVPSQYSPTGATIPPGKIAITPAEYEWLKALPPGFVDAQLLLPQLEARQADFLKPTPVSELELLGATKGPAGLNLFYGQIVDGQVLPGSVQVEKIQPVNEKAIENELLAKGIRLILVADRADP